MRRIVQLEYKKLIRRVQDQSDKRKNHVLITKRGLNVMNQARKIENDVSDTIRNIFTNHEFELPYQAMDKISMHFTEIVK